MIYEESKPISQTQAKRIKAGSPVLYRVEPLRGASKDFDLTLGKEYVVREKYESPCGLGAVILNDKDEEFSILFSLLGKPLKRK